MKYLIAYGIGLVIVKVILLFAPVTKVKSLVEAYIVMFFRMIVLPFWLGMILMYFAGKL